MTPSRGRVSAEFERFATLVTPELRRRGLLPGAGDQTVGLTLRETLTSAGSQRPADYKGAGYRRAAPLVE